VRRNRRSLFFFLFFFLPLSTPVGTGAIGQRGDAFFFFSSFPPVSCLFWSRAGTRKTRRDRGGRELSLLFVMRSRLMDNEERTTIEEVCSSLLPSFFPSSSLLRPRPLEPGGEITGVPQHEDGFWSITKRLPLSPLPFPTFLTALTHERHDDGGDWSRRCFFPPSFFIPYPAEGRFFKRGIKEEADRRPRGRFFFPPFSFLDRLEGAGLVRNSVRTN